MKCKKVCALCLGLLAAHGAFAMQGTKNTNGLIRHIGAYPSLA